MVCKQDDRRKKKKKFAFNQRVIIGINTDNISIVFLCLCIFIFRSYSGHEDYTTIVFLHFIFNVYFSFQFVNKNYHEPVYAQLLNDHAALQKVYNELKEKLELKTKEMERLNNETMKKAQENGINLIMAEQIRILKEREAQLMSEAEELREQNDLMEFRILELEECRKEVRGRSQSII